MVELDRKVIEYPACFVCYDRENHQLCPPLETLGESRYGDVLTLLLSEEQCKLYNSADWFSFRNDIWNLRNGRVTTAFRDSMLHQYNGVTIDSVSGRHLASASRGPSTMEIRKIYFRFESCLKIQYDYDAFVAKIQKGRA